MIDPTEGDEAERNFRTFEENLKELKYAMKILQTPLRILDLKRRFHEQTMNSLDLNSSGAMDAKLHNQKIGREELLDDLWALTKPLPPPLPPQQQADYKPDNDIP